MRLAYVFWHRPAPAVAPAEHEERLRAFHEALDLAGSGTLRLERPPWDGEPAGGWYEDWYPVEGWAELGALGERALSGARRAPHDTAAAGTADGAAGVYGLRRAGTAPAEAAWAGWVGKPAGTAYEPFLAEIGRAAPGAAVWQRQLVLGPTPEFCVLAARPVALPWPVQVTGPRQV